MTDNTELPNKSESFQSSENKTTTRRSVIKGVAATGTALAGVGLSGAASAQQTNVSADQLFGAGLITVQGVDLLSNLDFENVTIDVVDVETGDILSNIEVTVTDVNILNDNVVNLDVDVDITDTLNRNVVQVNVLSDTDSLIGTDAVNVPGNLR